MLKYAVPFLAVCAGASEITFQAPSASEQNFTVTATEVVTTITPSSVATVLVGDIYATQTSTAVVQHAYQIAGNLESTSTKVTCHNGLVTYNCTNGSKSVAVAVTKPEYPGIRRGLLVTPRQNAPIITTVLTNLRDPDSFSTKCSDELYWLLEGLTPSSTTQNMFTGGTWNTSNFVYPVDLSGISLGQYKFVAISKRFVSSAKHAPYSVPREIQFLGRDNVLVTRNVIRRSEIGTSSLVDDISIGMLDQDLPDTVDVCSVMPNNWSSYIPTHYGYGTPGIALLTCNQFNKTSTVIWYNHDTYIIPPEFVYSENESYAWDNQLVLDFYIPKVNFDSSSPYFFIKDSKPIYFALTTSLYSGPLISNHLTGIQASFQSMAGESYRPLVDKLSIAELTNTPTYE